MIKEDFLYYIWKLRKFNLDKLQTTDGLPIVIEGFGDQNKDSGPDFSNARIRIGETLWFGNVEMHVFSSDWEKHTHHLDPAYNNVILHVVYENDQNINTESGITIPCLELKHRITKHDIKNYKLLRFNKHWIPCEPLLGSINAIAKVGALEKAVTERLIRKAQRFQEILEKNHNDWSQSFYVFLSRYFGMSINADAFEMLAESFSLNQLRRESDDLTKIEAILFGQAGLLNEEFNDDYPNKLKSEYKYYKSKYGLNHIPVSVWKYSRLRPSNFPAIRIAQMATLIFHNPDLFEQTIAQTSVEKLRNIFKADTSLYWTDHFNFDNESPKKEKNIGRSTLDILIVNAVIPVIFLYGHINGLQHYMDQAINLLTELPYENNSIIKKWKSLGFFSRTAYDSQALLELKSNCCDKQKCLECPIGNEIMKNN